MQGVDYAHDWETAPDRHWEAISTVAKQVANRFFGRVRTAEDAGRRSGWSDGENSLMNGVDCGLILPVNWEETCFSFRTR